MRFGSPVVTLVQNGIAAGAVVTESGESGVKGHFPWLRQSLAAQTRGPSLSFLARGSASCCSFTGLLGKGQQGMLVALWNKGVAWTLVTLEDQDGITFYTE